jgi:hypothetical protein
MLKRNPELNRDIEIVVSTAPSTHGARWDFLQGRHRITLRLPFLFNEGMNKVDDYREYTIRDLEDFEHVPAFWAYEEAFVELLNEAFLTELVCIERHRQGLRMNYPHCNPCCLFRVVAFMTDHINRHLHYHLKRRETIEALLENRRP